MEAPSSASEYQNGFPQSEKIESQIRYLLTSAIRAPSTHNSQPWKFALEGGLLRVYRDESVVLPNSDPKGRYAHVSLGFLLHHIFVLATYSGMECKLLKTLSGNLIAELEFSSSNKFDPSYAQLVEALLTRKNRRGKFLSEEILLEVLKNATVASPFLPSGLAVTETVFIAKSEEKETIAKLTAQNMLRVYALPAFRREMSRWITPTGSPKKTGLPGYTLNQPVLLSWILPTMIRFINMGPVLAKLNYGSLASASAIIGFANEESPIGWVATGFQASQVALTLVSQGFDYSVFVASIEYDDTRKSAAETFGLHQPLQFLFAVGKLPGQANWKTPRIPIEKKGLPA